MAKKKTTIEQKKQIEVRIAVDQRLYGKIDDAILYLQEIRDKYQGIDITLDLHWTDYEEADNTFVYYREETDEEFENRLAVIAMERKLAAEQAERQAQRKKDLMKLAALKRKLGVD